MSSSSLFASCSGCSSPKVESWSKRLKAVDNTLDNFAYGLEGVRGGIDAYNTSGTFNGEAVSNDCEDVRKQVALTEKSVRLVRLITCIGKTPEVIKKDEKTGKRDWMGIIIHVLILVTRILNPLVWLHELKALDLGKHFNNICTAISAFWTVILTFCFVDAVNKYRSYVWKAGDGPDEPAKLGRQVATSFVDFLSIPGENFTFSNPIFTFVGAILSVLSSAVHLLVEIVDG